MNLLTELEFRRNAALIRQSRRRGEGMPLVIAASTDTSLEFARRLARAMPVAIIGSRVLLSQWSPSLAALAGSPLDTWRSIRTAEQLPFAVISFPDQWVGGDASFQNIAFDHRPCGFSIVEVMLWMKFRLPVFLGATDFRGCGEHAVATLKLRRFAEEPPVDLTKEAFGRRLEQLMQPVIDCARRPHHAWRARDIFALKFAENREAAFKLKLLEIEGLLRIGGDLPAAPCHEPLIAELQATRRAPMNAAEFA